MNKKIFGLTRYNVNGRVLSILSVNMIEKKNILNEAAIPVDQSQAG